MDKKPIPFLYYTDGIILDRETVIIPSGFLEFPDAPTSRIVMKFGSVWGAHDVPDDFIVSVTHTNGQCFALGRNGLVKTFGPRGQPFTLDRVRGTFRETWLIDVEERGNMERIRAIGKDVYACGWGGQIYRLDDDQWVHFEQGIENPLDFAFVDICGTSSSDLYVFGMKGVMFYFDGSSWTQLDSPTNTHVYTAYCRSQDDIYIGGAHGSLYRGNRNAWQFIGSEEYTKNIWCITEFSDSMYLAYSDGLLKYDSGGLQEVDMNIGFKPTVHRLYAEDGRLWSFGEYDLVEFDGQVWSPISCPENEM